jgi:methionine-rich copper-binding protein CopC
MKLQGLRSRAGSRLAVRLAPVAVLLGAMAALAVPNVAFAHAGYDHSDPAAGSTIQTAPSTVSIFFLENVNPQGSDITIYDSKGKVVSTGPAQVDRADAKKLTVNMQGDDSEIYLVTWHNVSLDDNDPDTGAFTFNVGTSDTAPSTTTTPTASSSSSVPGWLAALIGVAGLVVGAGGGIVIARRQGR